MNRRTIHVLALFVAALSGCGGVTRFHAERPVTVTAAPPPPVVTEAPAPPPPPEPKPVAKLEDDKIEISEKIQFEANRAIIRPVSHALLKEVADILKRSPEVEVVAIGGHASSEGNAKANDALAEARAKAVMRFLVDHEGISAARLQETYERAHPRADREPNGSHRGTL